MSDKPRPHVCTTCSRCFARLEHLKRHERSHTKEKPFECPECLRCFARRDLLLRHQQKLHSTTTPASRPRSSRRETNGGPGPSPSGRVRKNSAINHFAAGMRPRANTLSHVDASSMKLLASSHKARKNARTNHVHQMNETHAAAVTGYQYPCSSNLQHGNLSALPRLNTGALPTEHAGGLRTAPAFGGFPTNFNMNAFAFDHANTINPSQLHMGDEKGMGTEGHDPNYQYRHYSSAADFSDMQHSSQMHWPVHGIDSSLYFTPTSDSAIETSSPSAMDTNSPGQVSDGMLDNNTSMMNAFPASAPPMWNVSPVFAQTQSMAKPVNNYEMVPPVRNLEILSPRFNDMVPAPPGTISPKSLLAQGGSLQEMKMPSPPPVNSMNAPHSIMSRYAMPQGQTPMIPTDGLSTAPSSLYDMGLGIQGHQAGSWHIMGVCGEYLPARGSQWATM
jgi:hypothetical protein